MTETTEPNWAHANCGGFPDPEEFFRPDGSVPEHVAALCHVCTIRDACFDWADQTGQLGVWGATSTAQREAMATGIQRANCPTCHAPAPFQHEAAQVCGYCGMSWPVRRVKKGSAR